MPVRTLLALSAALLLPAAASAQAVPPPRPIQIENGKLQGFLTPDNQVIAYKGIPYAQPPVEELRWAPPMPLAGKWKKVLAARDFGPHCIQAGSFPDMVFHDPGPSEDCLTLNVWAPASTIAKHPTRKLPVMVWIYGGGFTTGGSSEARQWGDALARRGVLVVSMNYRLGIFGFFSLPELATESSHHASDNYGLMDQAAAIAWVHRNIAAFGGDPANVTIFGQSAGSMSVSAQMASPLANAYIARAIGQSGSEFPTNGRPMPSLDEANQANAAWATRAFGSDKLFYLRQLHTDEIVNAVNSRTQRAPRFWPILDGYFYPESVPNIYADGKQAHIPLLAGWVADEQHNNRPPTAEAFQNQLRTTFGDHAAEALAAYPASTDAEAARSANDLAGDRFIAYCTWEWIEAQTRTGGAPVYRYFFDLPNPGDRNHKPELGAFHADDIEYAFGTLDSRPQMNIRPEDRALSELMQQYFVNFARTGNPNGPGLPNWPTYTPGGPVMQLDANPIARPDPYRQRYLLLHELYTTQPAAPTTR